MDCIHGPIDKTGLGAEVPGLNTVDGMQLYIDPEECIDCGACEPECPVEAIFEEDAVPDEWKKFIKINALFCNTISFILPKSFRKQSFQKSFPF